MYVDCPRFNKGRNCAVLERFHTFHHHITYTCIEPIELSLSFSERTGDLFLQV